MVKQASEGEEEIILKKVYFELTDSFVAILGLTLILSGGTTVMVAGIVAAAVGASNYKFTNEDGSLDITIYVPNLGNIVTCLTIGQYLGQAKVFGDFYNFFWSGPNRCFDV